MFNRLGRCTLPVAVKLDNKGNTNLSLLLGVVAPLLGCAVTEPVFQFVVLPLPSVSQYCFELITSNTQTIYASFQ